MMNQNPSRALFGSHPSSSPCTLITQNDEPQHKDSHALLTQSESFLDQQGKTLQLKSSSERAKPQRTKRPERQLYSVRQRVLMKQNEEMKAKQDSSQCSGQIEGKPDAKEEKELNQYEEDNLSTSNASTAISERYKGIDEEQASRNESVKGKEDSIELAQNLLANQAPEILFELQFESQNGFISFPIHRDEDGYEQQLDQMCLKLGLDPRSSLYFQINVLLMLDSILDNTEKLKAPLENLLDVNYKLLMYESGLGEFEECLRVYLDPANQQTSQLDENPSFTF